MPSTKLVIGGAAAGAALGVRVARSLYSRWRVLPVADRDRIERLSPRTPRSKALSVRGANDPTLAQADLRAASETLAAALVETAEADPAIGADEVRGAPRGVEARAGAARHGRH